MIGVWKIAEEESFFLEKAVVQREITHPHKRKQHLAGRYLLRELCPDFPLDGIQISPTQKPFLWENPYHFSISHSGDYAAAIVSGDQRVGIDVELYSEKVLKVLHKFLTPDEMNLLNGLKVVDHRMETLCWSVKESVFKWFGMGEVDFREDIRIQRIDNKGLNAVDIQVDFRGRALLVYGTCYPDFCLTWLATAH